MSVNVDIEKIASDMYESMGHHIEMSHNASPRIFVYNGEIHFDSNSPIFGINEIMYNHSNECEIIYEKEKWDEDAWGTSNASEERNARINGIYNAIDNVLNN